MSDVLRVTAGTENSSNLLQLDVRIQLVHPAATLPVQGSDSAIGYDLTCVAGTEGLDKLAWSDTQLSSWERAALTGYVSLAAGEGYLFRTGVKQMFNPNYGCFLFDRSGMGAKNMVARLAGVIDPDYRGEIFVRLVNLSGTNKRIEIGSKIIQAVYLPRVHATFAAVDTLDETARGTAGFGSTDKQGQSCTET